MGMYQGAKTEKNFAYYTAILSVAVMINIYIGVSYIEYCILIMLAASVYAAEYFNTAIEHISNIIDQSYNSEIKIIKDIAAGAVLTIGTAFIIVEILILGANL